MKFIQVCFYRILYQAVRVWAGVECGVKAELFSDMGIVVLTHTHQSCGSMAVCLHLLRQYLIHEGDAEEEFILFIISAGS